ncbi:hypothetical protein EMIHUDRAFT_454346 [Emiliania huxleyi CCMP1516]|uniref:Uncharacterized protein n=2 Tax=Emiliania huxleyi TaxID=2903 RepID=A0A0D3KW01_EMIH1|nr:hypothetical protein EMIHUDRAFT_454346 [Emiliania huxleyi CCMP1516]EOD39936.1 hypothetical protein EMIHUDRAFT_454346 [Emiliania huxleyi CCMP1516]|eukprot:XP_005792365.1 hypothetical protein EMIHUDRAFT_454346 [Emiliania huxleyi CCMP1516]
MTRCTTATLSASATLLILSTGVASHAVRTTARSPGVTAVRGAALRPAYAPPLQRAARVPCPPRMASESAGESPVARARAWFGKWMKFDRASLSKLGVTVSVAWFTFCQSTGLSPLAPGQWSKFLAVYAGIYLTFGTITRPFRMAFSVGVTPLFGQTPPRDAAEMPPSAAEVTAERASLPFGETRPKLNRTLAILLFSVFGNTFCTLALIAAGVWVAGLLAGVPALPPGARPQRLGRGTVGEWVDPREAVPLYAVARA